jgi:four helix bundle protein
MNKEEFKKRTKLFSLRVIKLVESLSNGRIETILGNQLLRSGTSVGANYRSACRAKSTADFIFKMSIVEEEADETIYWMELLIEAGLLERDRLEKLITEANQLVAMTVASINTAKNKMKNRKSERASEFINSEIRNPKSEIS